MSKTFWVILGLVLIAGGLYFALGMNMPGGTTQEENNLAGGTMLEGTEGEWNDTPMDNQSGKKMAFSQFVKQGGSYMCEVNQYVNNVATKGTVYVNEGMISGKFSNQVNGLNVDANMIVRDGYTYSWTSMTPNMGFKAKMNNEDSGDTSTGTSGTYSWNADEVGDYNCTPWALDASYFELPANVNFQELNQ